MNNPSFTRDQVLKRLSQSEPALVTFTKVNGEKREMLCTTHKDSIPAELAPKGTDKEFNPDNIRVYDIDNKGWRSFRINSIISIK